MPYAHRCPYVTTMAHTICSRCSESVLKHQTHTLLPAAVSPCPLSLILPHVLVFPALLQAIPVLALPIVTLFLYDLRHCTGIPTKHGNLTHTHAPHTQMNPLHPTTEQAAVARQVFRNWLWNEMMLGPPAAHVRRLANGRREVRYCLTEQDTEYVEWEADDINRDLEDWQLLSLICPEAPPIRLTIDAYDRSRLRDSLVDYCTPRSIQWLHYATAGFQRHQVTINILRPHPPTMRHPEWARWHYYLGVCRALASSVVISNAPDARSCYGNIVLPWQDWHAR